MQKLFSLFSTLSIAVAVCAQAVTDPVITSWIQTPGQNGYLGISANVQKVDYTATDVYVTCSCIPSYDIGPWAGNPNTPANQNFCFKIPRSPQPNNGTLTATSLGHIGVWTNGVSLFNAKDAMSYNNQNVWFRNAYFFEGSSFDDCLGHPAPNGEYHTHVNPTCLYDDQNQQTHSPIIGYAFDGYPIYGAYGYTNANGTGGVKRMVSSYRTRNITQRTTLPDGSNASSAGPAINTQYPLGAFIEDHEYVQGLGDLDEHNGRFTVTPEYPSGTYAYFVTIDENQNPVYPYLLGPTYYGVVAQGNIGPQSGHNTIPSNAVTYTPAVSGIETTTSDVPQVYPQPFRDFLIVSNPSGTVEETVQLIDARGAVIMQESFTGTVKLATTSLAPGIYLLSTSNTILKVVKTN